MEYLRMLKIMVLTLALFSKAVNSVTTTPRCKIFGVISPILLNAGDQVILQSPNYPSNYNPLTSCGWSVRCNVFPTSSLNMTCDNNFALQDRVLGLCLNDRLIIQQPFSLISNTYCGTTKPNDTVFKSGLVDFQFYTNLLNQYTGFKCTLTCSAGSSSG